MEKKLGNTKVYRNEFQMIEMMLHKQGAWKKCILRLVIHTLGTTHKINVVFYAAAHHLGGNASIIQNIKPNIQKIYQFEEFNLMHLYKIAFRSLLPEGNPCLIQGLRCRSWKVLLLIGTQDKEYRRTVTIWLLGPQPDLALILQSVEGSKMNMRIG